MHVRFTFLLVFTLAITLAALPTSGWPQTRSSGLAQAASSWTRTIKLSAADGSSNASFGSGIAMSGDTMVVGAPDQGNKGVAYVFTKSSGGWALAAKLTASNAATDDQFGKAVAISGDTIVVGASEDRWPVDPGPGAVYIFLRPVSGWGATTPPAAELTAEYGFPFARLGAAVAIDGDTVAVGAPFMNWRGVDQEGEVFIFQKSGAAWSGSLHETATLVDSLGSSEGAYADFGMAVAISGDKVVIGAPQASVGGGNPQGAAFIATRLAAGWSNTDLTHADWLNVSDANAAGGIGKAVAANSTTLMVGASGAKIGANAGQGAVYGFTQAQGNSYSIFLPLLRK